MHPSHPTALVNSKQTARQMSKGIFEHPVSSLPTKLSINAGESPPKITQVWLRSAVPCN